ncbi:MAG: hypothetical protein ACE5JU_25690 [Candidatus Binatia bacterium]
MKNQYFGDIYDYIKYGLLRQLSCYGKLSTVVCWMLTENDERRDGHRIHYLREPESWRRFDPRVFDCLRTAVLHRKVRDIKVIEKSSLLPDSRFYSHLLTDDHAERRNYFDGFLDFARGKELVFFDPDNGLEIKSVKYGRKGSCRYLFWHEIEQAFSVGHSLLVYQHMPPKPRDPFVRRLVRGLARSTGSELVYVYRTQRVAFLLVPQLKQVEQFSEAASRVRAAWSDVLEIERHDLG